jgi:hypothetical protein
MYLFRSNPASEGFPDPKVVTMRVFPAQTGKRSHILTHTHTHTHTHTPAFPTPPTVLLSGSPTSQKLFFFFFFKEKEIHIAHSLFWKSQESKGLDSAGNRKSSPVPSFTVYKLVP